MDNHMKLLKKTTLLLLFLCLQILDASDIITLPDKVGKPRTLLAHEGKKVKTINPNISPEPITKEFAEGIMEYYKTSRLGKFVYQMHGKRLFMPTHCPHIFSMKSDNENVLIETYEKKEDYHKTIVLDRNGNIAGTKGVPLKLDHWPTVSYSSYTIHKNKCYQLKENYEAETWEIHITPLADWKSLK